MSVVVSAAQALYEPARLHLRGRVEQVGFFLADFNEKLNTFVLRAWRPMPPEAFEFQSSFHVTLRDEIRPEIIKWAWDKGACLVEAHSHGDEGTACFSPSDIAGFAEWVPHVRWRLSGKPYAALVTHGDTFDALAWLDGRGAQPTQVSRLEVDAEIYLPTGRTLQWLLDLGGRVRAD